MDGCLYAWLVVAVIVLNKVHSWACQPLAVQCGVRGMCGVWAGGGAMRCGRGGAGRQVSRHTGIFWVDSNIRVFICSLVRLEFTYVATAVEFCSLLNPRHILYCRNSVLKLHKEPRPIRARESSNHRPRGSRLRISSSWPSPRIDWTGSRRRW